MEQPRPMPPLRGSRGRPKSAPVSAAARRHLATWLERNGWTQATLARACGVTRNAIGIFMRGETGVSIALAQRVEKATSGGVTAATLLGV